MTIIAILTAALLCATTVAAYLWLLARDLERERDDQQAQLDAAAKRLNDVETARPPQCVTVCDPRKADWVVAE